MNWIPDSGTATVEIELQPLSRVEKSRAIWGIVCDYFNVTEEQLYSKTRTKTIALARAILMFALRVYCDYSYPEIGNIFNRDHKTAWNAYHKIYRLVNFDVGYIKTRTAVFAVLTKIVLRLNTLQGA